MEGKERCKDGEGKEVESVEEGQKEANKSLKENKNGGEKEEKE